MDNIEVVDVDNLYADLEDCRKQEHLLSCRIAEQKLGNVQRIIAEAQKHVAAALKELKSISEFIGPETIDLRSPTEILLAAKARVSLCHSSIGNCLNDINRAKAKEA